jgi:hypothetical protein
MAYLNANIPPIYCQIKREYLYDLQKHHGEAEDVVIFGIASIAGKAILFHCMLENGAIFYRLPISAFFQKHFQRTKVPDMQVHELQLWNCFSYHPSVHHFDFLSSARGKYKGIDEKFYPGEYLFTLDWASPDSNILDIEHSEIPQEHKCAHVLALDNGNFAAQPNNRIIWNIPSFTVKDNWPDYSVQTTYWNVENKGLVTEDSDKMFYEVNKKDEDNE